MYTWGYLKDNILAKLDLDEERANELGFLSRFPFFANEAMTQICSSVKPKECFFEIDNDEPGAVYKMPSDFISFSDDTAIVEFVEPYDCWQEEATDEHLTYKGYDEIVCKFKAHYVIPYNARWFTFSQDMVATDEITAPADICDAIPSYVVSQCLKIDDEVKASVYRNEFELFLARLDNTTFKRQRTFIVGGGW